MLASPLMQDDVTGFDAPSRWRVKDNCMR